jgi:hypothetical protein
MDGLGRGRLLMGPRGQGGSVKVMVKENKGVGVADCGGGWRMEVDGGRSVEPWSVVRACRFPAKVLMIPLTAFSYF